MILMFVALRQNNDTAVHMTCYEGYYDLLVVMLSNGFPVSPKNKVVTCIYNITMMLIYDQNIFNLFL